jgi:hypothetical protein
MVWQRSPVPPGSPDRPPRTTDNDRSSPTLPERQAIRLFLEPDPDEARHVVRNVTQHRRPASLSQPSRLHS